MVATGFAAATPRPNLDDARRRAGEAAVRDAFLVAFDETAMVCAGLAVGASAAAAGLLGRRRGVPRPA